MGLVACRELPRVGTVRFLPRLRAGGKGTVFSRAPQRGEESSSMTEHNFQFCHPPDHRIRVVGLEGTFRGHLVQSPCNDMVQWNSARPFPIIRWRHLLDAFFGLQCGVQQHFSLLHQRGDRVGFHCTKI